MGRSLAAGITGGGEQEQRSMNADRVLKQMVLEDLKKALARATQYGVGADCELLQLRAHLHVFR